MKRVVAMMRGGRANMVHGSDTGTDSDMPGLEESSSDESDDDTSDEWATDDELNLYDNVARFAFEAEARKARARTRRVVHTPQSWHALLHAGRKLSWATAKSSDALFDINGKVKVGRDLTSKDREELDKAAAACRTCKQTKLPAPAARSSRRHASAKRRGD